MIIKNMFLYALIINVDSIRLLILIESTELLESYELNIIY